VGVEISSLTLQREREYLILKGRPVRSIEKRIIQDKKDE
jgi:hypothetical protein